MLASVSNYATKVREGTLGSKLRIAALFVGVAGLLFSAGGIWVAVLSSPLSYCYHTAHSFSCFHDLETCEAETKLDGPITSTCKWEDAPLIR